MIRFCRAAGADYAELDVLRDRKNGRIYAVDLNQTPTGPQARMIARDAQRWWRRQEGAWCALLSAHAQQG